jgi:hypothetical protein
MIQATLPKKALFPCTLPSPMQLKNRTGEENRKENEKVRGTNKETATIVARKIGDSCSKREASRRFIVPVCGDIILQ